MSWAVRITLDENDLASVIQKWAGHCEQIIAYEHPAPPAARTHCHLLLIKCKVTTQRLKQISGREERGKTFWNFKAIRGPTLNFAETWADTDKYITYMSKGIYEPSYVGTQFYYDWTALEVLKQKWVAPAPTTPKLTTLQRYLEFEKLVRLLPIGQRGDEYDIKVHARAYLWPHYQMVSQQYKNDLSNFVETYKIKYFR